MRWRTAIVLGMLIAAPLEGQGLQLRSVEANVGLGTGDGGPFAGSGGIGLDALVSAVVRPAARGHLVAAVSGGAQIPLGDGDTYCGLTPGDVCAPEYPLLAPLAVLGGWEPRNGAVRLLLGPAYVYTEAGGVRGATGGLVGRVDFSSPPLFGLAATLSGRSLVVPSYRGEVLRHFAVGVGLRLR